MDVLKLKIAIVLIPSKAFVGPISFVHLHFMFIGSWR